MPSRYGRLRHWAALAALCVLALLPGVQAVERRSVVVAVTAFDDPAVIREQLRPLVDVLEEVLPDIRVNLAIANQDGVEALLRGNRADAVVTNPYHYLLLRHSDTLSGALATVERGAPHGAIGSMGGTVVVPAQREELLGLADLWGQRIAIADRRSTGGYVLPLAELERAGVDRKRVQWTVTGSPRAAVEAVLAGEADAAFLRSSLLEALLRRGVLEEGTLRVLNRQALGDYPYAVSTRLYPEWPLVFVAGSDMDVLMRILGAAMMRPGGVVIREPGAIAALQPPADYEPLRDLVRELQLPPYDMPEQFTLGDIWRQHTIGLVLVAIVALLVTLLFTVLLLGNQRLRNLYRERNRALKDRDRDARRLADLNRHFELLLERSTDFIYFKDADRRFLFVSRSLAELTGHTERHDLEGRATQDVFPSDTGSGYEGIERRVLERGEAVEDFRHNYRLPEGGTGTVSLHLWPIADARGKVVGLCAIGRDITERELQEKELERAANFDALTGLPNRNLFFDRLHNAMAACERRNTEIGLVYLDLDNFKPVNDTLGHGAGDELLKRIAERLQRGLRKSDTVARLGGDEFVLLLAEFGSRRECTALVERTLKRLAEPLQIADTTLEITASAGLAFFGAGHGEDADHLMRQADQAMYRAKEAGRACFRIFDEQQDSELRAFLERVATGIAREQFELHYQPVVDMRSGELDAVEALLRWRDDSGELRAPGYFLPRLQGHSLARDLEGWVLRTAVKQLRAWRDAGLEVTMHVNVAASDISEPAFVRRLRDLLADHSLQGGLCLEILESEALADAEIVNRVIGECADLGISFALDDFGTGYSSLAHLKDLRAHCVKIDQRFVQSLFHSHDDFSLLAAIVAMARAFERSLVAEGVETVEQGAMLLRLGCRVGQGYFIARPMPAAQFDEWRRTWQPPAAWTDLDPDLSVDSGEASDLRQQAWREQVERLVNARSA